MERRPTRGDSILAAVRDDILNGRLEPGTQLAFAELGRRYGASTGVLREVLPRLVEQGLATTQPQLGYRVVTLSLQELRHLTEARVALEGLVFQQSIRNGDLDWEAAVVGSHHRLTQLPTFDDAGSLSHTWAAEHRRFHEILLASCPNPRLREVASRLRDASEVYRCWSALNTEHISQRDDEHQRLATFAVNRDVEQACQALREHIERTTELLIQTQTQDATQPVH